MSDQPQRVRWHYPDSEVVSPDRVVEGSPDKFRELQDTVGDHPHGEPELIEGEIGDGDEGDGQEPADLITHEGGGWYSIDGLDDNVRGREAALEAAEASLEGD